MRLLSLINESVDPAYLKQRYDHYNQRLFNGALPTIPILVKPLKGKGGVVKASYDRVGPPPNPMMVRLGRVDKYANIKITKLWMEITSLHPRTDQALDGLLLHEMIHVYFITNAMYSVNHGPKFEAMVSHLSKETGIKIPMIDEASPDEIATDEIKTVFVVLLTKRDGTYAFNILSSASINKIGLQAVVDFWLGRLNGMFKDFVIIRIASPTWTKMSMHYPLQRKPAAKGYTMLTVPQFEDLKKGQIIYRSADKEKAGH